MKFALKHLDELGVRKINRGFTRINADMRQTKSKPKYADMKQTKSKPPMDTEDADQNQPEFLPAFP
jgi:hypothetical protein